MSRATLVLATLAAVSASAAPRLVLVDAPPVARKAIETALPRGSVVKGPAFDERDAESVTRATRSANAVAAIKARADAKLITVELFNAADGASLARVVAPAPKKGPLKALPKPAIAALLKALARAQPPTRARPAPADPGPPEVSATTRPAPAEPVEPAAPASKGRAPEPRTADASRPTVTSPVEVRADDRAVDALNFRVGPRLFQRSLTWTDDIFKQLGGYGLPAAPAIAVEARLFPGAFFTTGVLANLGVAASFEQSIGIKSTDSEGGTYATGAMRFRVGALARVRVSRLTLLPHAGWSMQSFTIAAASNNGSPRALPNVRYGTLRAGLTLGVELIGPLSLEAGGAYQFVLSTGEIASSGYFPRTTAGGADFEVAAVLRIAQHFEVRLSAEYLRFWMSMNVRPGDPWIAGGALDEYKSVLLTAAFVL